MVFPFAGEQEKPRHRNGQPNLPGTDYINKGTEIVHRIRRVADADSRSFAPLTATLRKDSDRRHHQINAGQLWTITKSQQFLCFADKS